MSREGVQQVVQLIGHAFGGVPSPVSDMLDSERVPVAGHGEPRRSVDQNECIVDEIFLAEFPTEQFEQRGGTGRIQSLAGGWGRDRPPRTARIAGR